MIPIYARIHITYEDGVHITYLGVLGRIDGKSYWLFGGNETLVKGMGLDLPLIQIRQRDLCYLFSSRGSITNFLAYEFDEIKYAQALKELEEWREKDNC